MYYHVYNQMNLQAPAASVLTERHPSVHGMAQDFSAQFSVHGILGL